MKKTLLLFAVIFCCYALIPAEAIQIVKGFKKANAAVPDITENGQIASSQDVKVMSTVLQFDMDNSGYIKILENRQLLNKLLRADVASNRTLLGSWSATGANLLIKTDCQLVGDKAKLTCVIYDLKTSKNIYSKTVSGTREKKRYLVHSLANSIIKELTGEEGIATTKIVFSADRGVSGKKEIYLMDYDGANMKQITRDNVVSVVPSFTPDGVTVYYTTYLKGYPKIARINLTTGKRDIVSSYAGLNAFPALSPNGREMALSLSKDGAVDIYLADINGNNPQRLTKSGQGVASSPCWSPDGSQLAYISNVRGSAQVYIMDRTGRNIQRISRGYGYAASVDWSPKGNLIAFSAKSGPYRQIFLYDIKTGGIEQLTNSSANHEKPCFAPDGIHLMYCRESNFEKDIYLTDVYEKKPVRITSLAGNETYPDWSPVSY